MIRNFLFATVLLSCLLTGPQAQARKTIVAVFNIEFKRVRMPGPVREALRDYIETRLTASGVYEVVPPGQLKRALSKQKIKSYRRCYKESCQIRIGEELSADRTLSTRVTRIGQTCMVSMKLYHLKRMTSEKGETARGKCTEQGIMKSLRAVVTKLARGSGGSTGSGGPGPALGGPQVSGGAVTKALARLIVKIRPAPARVRVTGPGGFSATGGATWERADLKPGTYQVVAGASGYATTTRTATLNADDLKTLTITLERPGTLIVLGKPAGANTEITGPGGFSVVKGLPVKVSGAPRGTYHVKVTREGYRTEERDAVVQPSKTTTVNVALARSGGAVGKAGIKWVAILGGSFNMGSTVGGGDERPIHPVTLSTFYMMKNEVTVDQYRACVTAGGCTSNHLGGYEWPGKKYSTSEFCNWPHANRGSHPINCVNWAQARAFCAWAGGRLPTEAEWEYAARGRGLPREYPWGNEAATCARAIIGHKGTCTTQNPCGCGKNTTWPVCSKRAGNTVQGLCDMAGNVWEWVEDCWHNDYNGAPANGSAWTGNCVGTYRILRGGAGNRTTKLLRSAYRYRLHPIYRYDYLGIRCAR